MSKVQIQECDVTVNLRRCPLVDVQAEDSIYSKRYHFQEIVLVLYIMLMIKVWLDQLSDAIAIRAMASIEIIRQTSS
jgi:hypothetical protein